jgi:four helix bundle protein
MERKNLFFQLADKISKEGFKISLLLENKFQYSIGDQLRRSSLSIVLNIVEGGARISLIKDKEILNLIDNLLVDINHLAKLLYGLLYKK